MIFFQVCAVINLAVIPFTEGLEPFYDVMRLGPLILISNALIAFLLNIAAVFLVGAGSGLVLTLAGVFKVRGTSNLVLLYNLFIPASINLPIVNWSCAHFVLFRLGRTSYSSRALCSSSVSRLRHSRFSGMPLHSSGSWFTRPLVASELHERSTSPRFTSCYLVIFLLLLIALAHTRTPAYR